MATNKKTKRKSAKKINVIAEIKKTNNMKVEFPGLDLLNKAEDALRKHIAKKPVDAVASKKALRALTGAKKEFNTDPDQAYRTAHARKLAGMVDAEVRRIAAAGGTNAASEINVALAYKDKVEKLTKTKSKGVKWVAEEILEAVEKIPGLSTDGVQTKPELEKMYKTAQRKGKKFVNKAYKLWGSLRGAGNDRDCDLVHKHGRKYIPRPKSSVKSAIEKSGSAR